MLQEFVKTLEEQTAIVSQKLTELFGDMFIVDSLIGKFALQTYN